MNKIHRSYQIYTEEGFNELVSKSKNYIQREYLSLSRPPYTTRIKIANGVSKLLQYLNMSDSVVDSILNVNRYKKLNFIEQSSFNKLNDTTIVKDNHELSRSEIRTIYPTSSDAIPIQINQNTKDQCIFAGIANVNSLDVLANLQPSKIVFTDINFAQAKYLQFLIELIINSEDRAEFLSNLLDKERSELYDILVTIQNQDIDKLSNEEKVKLENEFWSCLNSRSRNYKSSDHETLYSEFLTYNTVSEEDGTIKGIVFENMGKNALINEKSPSDVDIMTTFLIDDVDSIQSRPSRNGRYNPHPIYRQGGFLGSEQAYQQLRTNLTEKPYIIFHNTMDSNLIYTIVKSYQNEQIVVWLSNLFAGAFESAETKSMVDTIALLDSKYDILAIENTRVLK